MNLDHALATIIRANAAGERLVAYTVKDDNVELKFERPATVTVYVLPVKGEAHEG